MTKHHETAVLPTRGLTLDPFDNNTVLEGAEDRLLQGDYVPPWTKTTKVAPKVTLGWRDQLEEAIQPWHSALNSKKVDASLAAFVESMDEAEVAADSVMAIGEDQRREAKAIEARAVADAKAGTISEPTVTDFSYERARREAIWASAHAVAKAAQQTYLRTVRAEAPARVEALVDDAARARAKALKAMATASSAVHEAVAAVRAIGAADLALGIQPKRWHRTTPDRQAMPDRALAALDQISEYLNADDAMLTGEYVLSSGTTLPPHTRRALAMSDRIEDAWILYQVEAIEGYTVSAHAKQLEHSYPVDPDFENEHLNKRDLPG